MPFHATIGAYLPELIYDANDGIVTTLAVISGVVGAQLSTQVILILGFANLLADGISMGASDFLSERSKVHDRLNFFQASKKGLATFGGFILAGIVPLLAYILPWFPDQPFAFAALMAAATLFAVGAARALFTDRGWLRAGAEMLLIGSAAGAVAYGVGMLGASYTSGWN